MTRRDSAPDCSKCSTSSPEGAETFRRSKVAVPRGRSADRVSLSLTSKTTGSSMEGRVHSTLWLKTGLHEELTTFVRVVIAPTVATTYGSDSPNASTSGKAIARRIVRVRWSFHVPSSSHCSSSCRLSGDNHWLSPAGPSDTFHLNSNRVFVGFPEAVRCTSFAPVTYTRSAIGMANPPTGSPEPSTRTSKCTAGGSWLSASPCGGTGKWYGPACQLGVFERGAEGVKASLPPHSTLHRHFIALASPAARSTHTAICPPFSASSSGLNGSDSSGGLGGAFSPSTLLRSPTTQSSIRILPRLPPAFSRSFSPSGSSSRAPRSTHRVALLSGKSCSSTSKGRTSAYPMKSLALMSMS
eukprot:Sspe_Gene.57962::Locus_31796_Transcript_1_1_Confidence_1.000_Length_5955::g.57962::m.57962